MKPDLTAYPRHRIRTRGSTFNAIPVDDPKPHRCHVRCRCRPKQIAKDGGDCWWHGLWMHNAKEDK